MNVSINKQLLRIIYLKMKKEKPIKKPKETEKYNKKLKKIQQ